MFGDNKNLKDSRNDLDLFIKDTPNAISYTKTNKLITALFMVTDIMDKEEPLRNKLRTLGIEIISDMRSVPAKVNGKVDEVMSFLEIASGINLISGMNCSILKKEFIALKQSIDQSVNNLTLSEEFFREDETENPLRSSPLFRERASMGNSIGVQKGSTLLRALSRVEMSNRNWTRPLGGSGTSNSTNNFHILKEQRQKDIIAVIKINGGSATITDIKSKAQGQLILCSEKTLQRELILMVKTGVLYREGSKRWSRYFLKT